MCFTLKFRKRQKREFQLLLFHSVMHQRVWNHCEMKLHINQISVCHSNSANTGPSSNNFHVKFLILIVCVPFPLQTTCLEVPHNHIQITFGQAAIRVSLRKQNRVYFSYQLNLQWCSQPSSKDIPVKPGLVKNPCKVWGWCPQMHVYGGFLKHQSLKVYQILSRMGTVLLKYLTGSLGFSLGLICVLPAAMMQSKRKH